MTEALRQALWPHGSGRDVFAIVDAARDQRLYWKLTDSFLPHSCLFAGKLPEALEMASPYLVQLFPDDKFTDFLAENLGQSLGIFLRCDQSLEEVRKHLRRFLRVKDSRGRMMLFRYYDPRVLRRYLPTCTNSELQTVFGPIDTFWSESEAWGELTRFEFHGRALKVDQQALGAGSEAGGLDVEVVPAQNLILAAAGSAPKQRVPVLLQGAGRGGRLRRSPEGLAIYRTASGAEEVPRHQGAYVIPGTELDPDVTVYAEASAPGRYRLELETATGAKAAADLVCAAMELDAGPGPITVGGPGERRRIVAGPVRPAGVVPRAELRVATGGPAVSLYSSADGGEGHPLSGGYSWEPGETAQEYWLEKHPAGPVASEGRLELRLEGLANAADIRAYSTGRVEPAGLPVPVCLAGAAEPVSYRVRAEPETLAISWHAQRDGADSAGLTTSGTAAQFVPPGPGEYTVRASAGGGSLWGGPAAEWALTVVSVGPVTNATTILPRAGGCVRAPGAPRMRLHSGATGAIRLEAVIPVTGGGPGGTSGVGAIRAGWINNILSDNCGARYRGGLIRALPRITAPGDSIVEGSLPGPVLDTGAGHPVIPGEVSWDDPRTLRVRAVLSPAAEWPLEDSGRTMEQMWRYLECRSYLAVWLEESPEYLTVLAHTGWSFTGDFAVTPQRVTRPMVPALAAQTASAIYPAPRTPAEAGLALDVPQV